MMTGKGPFKIDDTRNVVIPGNTDEAVSYAVELFISAAHDAISARGAFYVALSGGSTPKKIFTKLASDECKNRIDWSKAYIFWGDERSVGPEDKDSNYKMALDFGLHSLPIPKDHIFRMVAETIIEENAKAYENLIREKVPTQVFDLIMLGMGDDGHTASLFPNTDALDVTDRLVVANRVPQKSTMRMTFTFPLINKARNIHLYVMGDAKKEKVAEVLLDKTKSAPSSRVGSKKHPALWILDEDAATILRTKSV